MRGVRLLIGNEFHEMLVKYSKDFESDFSEFNSVVNISSVMLDIERRKYL